MTHWQEAIDLEHAIVRLVEATAPWQDRWDEHDGDKEDERANQEFDLSPEWVAAMDLDERLVYIARLVDIVRLSCGIEGEPDHTTDWGKWPRYERSLIAGQLYRQDRAEEAAA